ncbi:uncharacterized protein LOC120327919 [Styela clava]
MSTDLPVTLTYNATSANITNSTEFDFTSMLLTSKVVNGLLLFMSIWMLLSMGIYGSRNKKWRKTAGTSSLNSGIIYQACVVSIALLIPRLLLNILIFHLRNIGNAMEWCELITDISVTLRLISRYSIYLFLWLRQRILYQHPSTRQLGGTRVNIVSWASLLGILLTFVGLFCYSVAPASYESTRHDCVNTQQSLPFLVIGYMLGVLLIATQLLLLGLFIYPMVKSRSLRQQSIRQHHLADGESNDIMQHPYIGKNLNASCFCYGKTRFCKENNSIAHTVRRSVFCTIIAALSDILAAGVVFGLPPQTIPRPIQNVIFSTSTFINIFCALATFKKYWSILISPCDSCCTKRIENVRGDETLSRQMRTSSLTT